MAKVLPNFKTGDPEKLKIIGPFPFFHLFLNFMKKCRLLEFFQTFRKLLTLLIIIFCSISSITTVLFNWVSSYSTTGSSLFSLLQHVLNRNQLYVVFTCLSNIAPLERLWIIGKPRNIILRNTRATIVLGGSQFTRCIPLSKRDAKIKIRPDFLCSTSLVY